MTWLLSFLTPKNAILSSFIALAGLLAVQSYRLYDWQIDYAKLETEKAELKGSLMGTISANQSNLIMIDRYERENKELLNHNAQSKDQATIAEKQHEQNLTEIEKRYEKARKVQIAGSCANMVIDDSVIELLKQTRSSR